MKCSLLAIVFTALCFGCSTSKSAAPANAEPTKNHSQLGAWGVDLAAMDKTVKPGDDVKVQLHEGTISAKVQ